jgi:hypothetical protein
MTNIWQKRWFQPAPKNFFTCVFYLIVFTRVCVLDHQKKKKVAGQIRIRRSRRRESYLRKLWNDFPETLGKQIFSP